MRYKLKQGDIIIANLNPTKGREQQGKRPVVIVSSDEYYKMTGLIIMCPISRTDNEFPMHIPLPYGMKTTGSVLTQHVRTIDPMDREITYLEKMPEKTLERVLHFIKLVFDRE